MGSEPVKTESDTPLPEHGESQNGGRSGRNHPFFKSLLGMDLPFSEQIEQDAGGEVGQLLGVAMSFGDCSVGIDYSFLSKYRRMLAERLASFLV